jgi:citronellol/citronellal dehydrogenase
LAGKTLFISGASRGIGKAIALRAAKDGANVIVAAKSDKPHRVLPGTIHSTADEIAAAGGQALPVVMDVRDEKAVAHAVEKGAAHFGGIDIVVNNASAISLTQTADTPARRYDLMMDVNVRGTFLVTQAALPFLRKAENPHVLVLSPPIDLQPKWFAQHTAYTLSKYGMSLLVHGFAAEFSAYGIAVNALWPETLIRTDAMRVVASDLPYGKCRTPEIVAESAYGVFNLPAAAHTGQFFSDVFILQTYMGIDPDTFNEDPAVEPVKDLFVA